MYMVMYVSPSIEQANRVLNIWVETGIGGVTILESAGMQQALQRGIRDDVGILFTLSSLTRAQEVHHRTLLSAIRDDELLDRVIEATTKHVGDWMKPDVGVMFVWPLVKAFGLGKDF